jgi:hypothetical protein
MNPEPRNYLFRVHALLNLFYIGEVNSPYPDDSAGEYAAYNLSTKYVVELKLLRDTLHVITSYRKSIND